MADKLMYMPNDDKQNKHFYRFQLVVKTFCTLNLMNQPIKIDVHPYYDRQNNPYHRYNLIHYI